MITNDTSQKITLGSLVCAAMVVAIHICGDVENGSLVWWWEQVGHYGVFLAAVPFFFVCSGFFLGRHCEESGWWPRECRKRVRSLLVPFLIWSVVYAAFVVGAVASANILHGRGALQGLPGGRGYWLRAIGVYPFDYPLLVPLWYIRSLLIFVALSPLFAKLVRSFGRTFLVVVYVVALTSTAVLSPGRFFEFFDKVFRLDGLFYFCCGLFFAWRRNDLPHLSRRVAVLLLSGGFFAVALKSYLAFATGWQNDGLSRLLFVPPILAGMWTLLPALSVPSRLSKLSFPLYLLHGPVLYAGGLALRFHPECLSGWFCKYAFAVGTSVAMILLLRRLAPRITNVVFGGR